MSATSETTLSLARRWQRGEYADLLRPVQQHAEIECADLQRRRERRARDDGIGRQHPLVDVMAVLGGERQILGAGPDAERIQKRVTVIHREVASPVHLRLSGQSASALLRGSVDHIWSMTATAGRPGTDVWPPRRSRTPRPAPAAATMVTVVQTTSRPPRRTQSPRHAIIVGAAHGNDAGGCADRVTQHQVGGRGKSGQRGEQG